MISSAKKSVVDLVDLLYLKGVRHFIISPGSRNAPITIAANRHGGFKMHCIVDERSAAFFALGIAQQTHNLVVICCTSGTAALNYAPAIAEAYYQKIPLLILTADRPKEWIDQMDGQTIRQLNIYQNYIKASFEFPTEPSNEEELWHCNRIASEAIERAIYPEFGPVHINIPFREPLYNVSEYPDERNVHSFSTIQTQLELSTNESSLLIQQWQKANKILIVTGLMHTDEQLNDILATLSKQQKVAILTETTSNVFGDGFNRSIDRLINTIEGDENINDYFPDLLITIGGPVVSKKIKSFLRKNKQQKHWHINASNDYVDTYKNLTKIIPVQPSIALKLFVNENLLNTINYRDLWLSLDKKLTALFKDYMQTVDFSDLWVTQEVLHHTPKNSYLHLANSTAVRYSNLFNTCSDRFLKCYSNRGTSGIDGTVSTAVGAAIVSNTTNTLITGDLSFLYDSNALWIKPFPQNLKIVVINNGGGSIFRIIDGPASTPELEQFFEAKHDISLEYLCKTFGIKYSFANNKTNLNTALQNLYNHNEAEVLEVKTNYLTNPIVLKNYFTYLKNNL